MNTLGTYNETNLVFTDDKKINLTDMWKAADGRNSQRPAEWLRQVETINFLESLEEKLNVGEAHILESTRGAYGGTWGHYQVALAYAKYLSPEFHIWCNEVVKERIETEGVPKQAMSDFSKDDVIKLAQRVLADQDTIKQLEHKVTEDAPKVQVYDNYMSSDGLKSFSDVGRDLGIGAKTFCQMLVNDKILFRQGKRLKAYLRYIKAGYFKTVTDVKDGYTYTQHKVTPKGFVWLEGKYG